MAHDIHRGEPNSNESLQSPYHPHTRHKITGIAAALIVAALLVGVGGGFITGFFVGKASTKTTAATQSRALNGSNRRFGRGFGARGSVTAVDSGSITINNRQGQSVTYTLTSTTTVTDNGATASINDIKVGDVVIIRTAANNSNSTSTQTATSIDVNPTNNVGPMPGQTQSSSGGSSSTASPSNSI